ncbi:cyclase family protein [Cohnella abietis]|uniref:Cyclase n=1 Tax=Cohnella abietis TaxID=2507935 RepID=A0A3T1DF61_9BACL|nr:cyclase family protein [Cohnella abietis]BBI36525.1 cyclase [Cohnella abietis]
MRVLDITGPIRTGMWSYGDPLPSVEVEPIASLEAEGWKGHRLSLHTLAGTYIETADHLFADREQIADVPVNRFVNRAVVAQLKDKQPLEPITAAELIEATGADIRPGDALLVATGWERYWDDPRFITECPFFLPEAMEWVVSQNFSLLGLDIPCVQDPRNDDGVLNRLFFAEDRLLLAPLISLRGVGKGIFTLISLPLNIPGVCGTPCRAILIDQFSENMK